MPKTPRNWPAAALPRRLTREWAAYYCGLSPNTFDRRVAEGVFPGPGDDGKYDLRLLDAAIDRKSGLTDPEPQDQDDWTFHRPPRRGKRAA